MNRQIKIGVTILSVLIFITVINFVFSEFNIQININYRLDGGLGGHIMGTDYLGRDLLSSTLFGLWFSLITAILIVIVSSITGIFIGVITGYFGGVIEIIFLRLGDVILAFPGFLLMILWMFFIGNGYFTLVFAVSFSGWVGYARLIRGEVLKYKKKEFIIAARTYNASFFRIIFVHIFPHLIPIILVQSSVFISNVILLESSLNFLGLGVGAHIPTLGQLVFSGQSYLFQKPILLICPGVAMILLILAVNLIGEGIRSKENGYIG